jgi:hypothetical protein
MPQNISWKEIDDTSWNLDGSLWSFVFFNFYFSGCYIYLLHYAFSRNVDLELTVFCSTAVLFQRFTTTAAELNGALYVAGGYDFNKDSYLQL